MAKVVLNGKDIDLSTEENLLGFISYNAEVIDADRRGLSPYDVSPRAVEEIRLIKVKMEEKLKE